MTQARIDELEAQVAHYRRELGLLHTLGEVGAVRAQWALTPSEARLILCLHRRFPGLVTRDALLSAVTCDRVDEPEIKIVDVYVTKARAKMTFNAIVTHWGLGYSLSPAAHKAISAVLQPIARAA